MLFETRNVPWYKLPLLAAVIVAAGALVIPGMVVGWAKRQVWGA